MLSPCFVVICYLLFLIISSVPGKSGFSGQKPEKAGSDLTQHTATMLLLCCTNGFDVHFCHLLYSQAVKECFHHAASLCEGVLRVGTLGWPLEVSATHISHLQFASAMENILDSAFQQVW